MSRVRCDVLVEVQQLLVQGCVDFVIDEGYLYIHEVEGVRTWSEIPFHVMIRVCIFLELGPLRHVYVWISIRDPDTNDIIDESLIAANVFSVFAYKSVFVNSVVEVGV